MSSEKKNVLNNQELMEFVEILRISFSENSKDINEKEYEGLMNKFKAIDKEHFGQVIEYLERHDELDLLDHLYTTVFDFLNVSTGKFYQHLESNYKKVVEDAEATGNEKIDASIKLNSLMLFHSAAKQHLDILRDIKATNITQIIYLEKLIRAIKWAAFIIAFAIILTLITRIDREILIKILEIISKAL